MNINSKMKSMAVVFGVGLALVACSEGDVTPPPTFNAIDPSLQCPADQVGWDFTTGGADDQDVIPVRVGSEIKVQSVTYRCADTGSTTSRDLTASFRAECDNATRCDRPILRDNEMSMALGTCVRKTLMATYQCGNETTVYNISRINWTSAGVPAIVRSPENEPSQVISFACGNTINLVGYNYRYDGSQSLIYDAPNWMQRKCNGKRRCYVNDPTDLADYRAIQNDGKLRKFFYTCGTESAVRQAIIDNTAASSSQDFKNYIDFHCADTTSPTAKESNPVLYIKGVNYLKTSGADLPRATVDDVSKRVKTACETRRQCDVAIDRKDVPVGSEGAFEVEYWCGANSGKVTTRKYFYTLDIFGGTGIAGTKGLSLQCGGRLLVTDGTRPWVQSDGGCLEGVYACSLPPGADRTRVNYFCENGAGAANTVFFDVPDGGRIFDRTVECPLESGEIGIKITGVSYDGQPVSEKPLISALSTCNGRQNCLIKPYLNNARYQYRFVCPNASEVISVKTTVDGQAMEYLDCKPNVVVDAVYAQCAINNSGTFNSSMVRYSTAADPVCPPSPTCSLDYGKALTGVPATYLQTQCDAGVRVAWKCGGTQQTDKYFYPQGVKSSDGGSLAGDGGTVFVGQLNCPYDPNPRPGALPPVTKKCIPRTCAPTKKRNAQMDCVDDGQIQIYPWYASVPLWRDSSFNLTNVAKEGFPYMTYIREAHPAPAMSNANAGTMWAYDVFHKKDGTGSDVYAFRCTVGSMGYLGAANGFTYFGSSGSKQLGVLPDACFKDPPYGDLTSSWYQGSRRAGVMNEQVFRNTYNLVRTYLVAAFDSKGRVNVNWRTAPNPIGFFYTPATGFIDQFDYYAQMSDFYQKIPVTFAPSRQIELKSTSARLNQSVLVFEKEMFKNRQTLDLDFGWLMLGDSPFHPFSPKSRLVTSGGNPVTKRIDYRNLQVSVEIAKEDSSLPNKWVESNSEVVGKFFIGGGNAQEKKERFTVQLREATVQRIMTVRGTTGSKRPNGWMRNNIEVNSVFKLRLCMDMDGLARPIDQTDVDNKFVSVTYNGNEYKAGFTKRCSEEFPFTVVRDLFPKPVLPINAAENPTQKANSTGQGGDRVSTNDDVGVQQSCRRQCTTNADCGGATCEKPANAIGVCAETTENVQCTSKVSKGMIAGGDAFGRDIMSVKNAQDTDGPKPAAPTATEQYTSSRSSTNVYGYTVLDSEERKAGQLAGLTKKQTKISLGRVWASVAQIAEQLKKAEAANPSPVKKWFKPKRSHGLPGIAFGIGVDKFVPAGPVTLWVEVAFGLEVGFDVALTFITDKQTIATKNGEAIYSCLGTTPCLKKSTAEKDFIAANEDCSLQGGRLAEPRTAAQVTSLKSVQGSDDIWLGAQASHIFEDTTCNDLSNVTDADKAARLAACKAESATRYLWINGNVAMADTYADGTAYNQSVYANAGVNGFGAYGSIANNGSPLRSGLLMTSAGALRNYAATDKLSSSSSVTSGTPLKTAQYICEFDPAAAYKAVENSISAGVEASIGVTASGCWPSGVIGGCLSAEFKFITIGISIENGSKSTKIFDTSDTTTVPRATIGGSGSTAKWEWAALTGRIFVEVRYFFGSDEFTIVSYSGVAREENELWSNVEKFRRNKSDGGTP